MNAVFCRMSLMVPPVRAVSASPVLSSRVAQLVPSLLPWIVTVPAPMTCTDFVGHLDRDAGSPLSPFRAAHSWRHTPSWRKVPLVVVAIPSLRLRRPVLETALLPGGNAHLRDLLVQPGWQFVPLVLRSTFVEVHAI